MGDDSACQGQLGGIWNRLRINILEPVLSVCLACGRAVPQSQIDDLPGVVNWYILVV